VVDPDTPGNPYDPRTIRAFEDFDYHLEYNEEDELISFTSHDGLIRYTLNKDSFDDLITISVHTIKIDFKIACIYDNYVYEDMDRKTG
jgi:aromatic ring-opening dioxygenase LigB subunit